MFANIIIAEYVLFFLKYFDKLHEIKTKKLCNQSLQKLYCNMFKYALCTYRFINAFIISEIYQDVNLEHFQSGIKPPWRNRLARSAVNRKVGGSSPPGGEKFFLQKRRLVSTKTMAARWSRSRILALGRACSALCENLPIQEPQIHS